ncbi:metal-dependent hydrolase [Halobium salinum]|uniref:Metal-dependent hydrolase n=1 Tax=Halobium salinum TaxID=1364940 RepID=A0ABD5PAV3_9EURY|nr:metal-dependent hydrolase [Halobium salinum]
MWPWGHAAFGYVLLSLGSRAAGRGPPGGLAAVVLLFATQLPDVVDKTLSWGLGLFPAGYSVAHSVFVAVPLGLLGLALAVRRGRPEAGVALVVGWWSHLAGDVAVAMVSGYETDFERVLWPIVTLPAYAVERGLLERASYYFAAFVRELTAGQQFTLLAVYFGPFFLAFCLWLVDGAPGVAGLWRRLRRSMRAA